MAAAQSAMDAPRERDGSAIVAATEPGGSGAGGPATRPQPFAHHAPGVARVNNGSFGCCPAPVLAAQEAWRRRFLEQPDGF
eukprot:SM000014S00310  [mRNA]  locus=s14:658029:658271:+ [translate_table: standard]